MATNLQFIKSETITSSISTLDIDNVFSDKYDTYAITTSGICTTSTTANYVHLRLLDSTGTVISANEYDRATTTLKSETGFGEDSSTNTSQVVYFFGITDSEPESMGSVGYVYNPFDSSSYTFFTYQNSARVSGVHRGFKGIGVHKSAESCRGFQLVFLSAVDKGKVSVYGVK